MSKVAMNNTIIKFDERDAYAQGEEYFINICGFDFNKEKHQRMMKDGLKARIEGLEGIDIKVLISAYDAGVFSDEDKKIIIGETEFKCKAFEQLSSENIIEIYAYIITAGELIYSDEDNILKQLYSDIWGTAYTDAGRDLLEDYLREYGQNRFKGESGKDIFLTNSFGPGFYGMETSQTKDFFEILNGYEIGVEVRDTGVMVPLKTCAGFYMLVNDKACIPSPDCQECFSDHKNCEFCGVRYRTAYKGEK